MEPLRLQRLLLAAEAEAEQLRRQLEEARRERNEILGSRYWRAGEPMRRVSTRLRQLRHRLGPQTDSQPDPQAPRSAPVSSALIARPQAPDLPVQPGNQPFNPKRPSLLVVSHEASATGAPILALNLAQGYATSHNVLVLLLGDGGLHSTFQATACGLLGPPRGPIDAPALRRALAALPGRPWPELALVNSIESRGVLAALFEAAIPSLALLHEFPAYTRPLQASTEVFLWADATVFSCALTRNDTLAVGAPGGDPPLQVLPQGRCIPPTTDHSTTPDPGDAWQIPELARWQRAHGGASPQLILGAGAVQPRKGVDLFIAVAAALRVQPDRLFVWIGSGYDPEHDLQCSAWLQDQIRRSGLEHRLLMLPASPAYGALIQGCVAFLLTSRLDPLPNVAIDALAAGRPVLAFERASGIAELLAGDAELAAGVCPYLQPEAMAERLDTLLADPQRLQRLGERSRALAEQRFAMDTYLQNLLRLGREAGEQLRAEQAELQTIAAADLIDPDFFGGAHLGEPRLLAGLYRRQWQRRIGPRLPLPGFHPGIYAERSGCSGDALCSWLAAGRPAGPWSVPVIRCGDAGSTTPAAESTLSVGLHLHVFYPELLPDLLQRLGHNRTRPQLILTLPEGVDRALVEAVLAEAGVHDAELRPTPNRGRDIGPLLVELGLELDQRFAVHGHLHTKRSELVDGGVARRWRSFLLTNLLGDAQRPMLDAILAAFAADPQLGLVFPEDPNAVGWSANRPAAEALAPRLGLPLPLPQALRFPVGTMFWARRGALHTLYGLGLQWHDLPPEPVGYDGSLLHAVERLLPLVAQQAGTRLATTHVPGVTR
jgi:hypothetical protein